MENGAENEIPIWKAYGPSKETWKRQGNYFTPEDLVRMAEDFRDLTITQAPEKVYDAN